MAFSQVCLLGRSEFASVTWFRSVKKPSTYCREDCFVAWGREKKLSQQSGGRAVVCKNVTAGLPLPTPQRTGGVLICRPPTGCPVGGAGLRDKAAIWGWGLSATAKKMPVAENPPKPVATVCKQGI